MNLQPFPGPLVESVHQKGPLGGWEIALGAGEAKTGALSPGLNWPNPAADPHPSAAALAKTGSPSSVRMSPEPLGY